MFKVKNLTKYYGKKPILNGLSFEIFPSEIVGLLGSNGAGKTTAFYIITGLISSDGGSVFFNNQDITKTPIHKRSKMGLGYLAQEPSIFRGLTVEENILCILELLPLTKQKRYERLDELLHELNLEPLRKKMAQTLSGGERRRLEITRALVTEPSLLLLDEPFANIDPIAIQDLKKLIKLLKKKKISVLITDHNAREIFSIVDRSYLMQDGKILLEGSMETLLNNELAKKYYLGSEFILN